MTLPKLGCQLLVFSKKFNIENDIDIILNSVMDAGYAAVEGGTSNAVGYRAKLDERGLTYAGSHVGLRALLDVRTLVNYCKIVGGYDICNSGLMQWNERSLDDYLQAIDILNQAGKSLRGEGIHLHYHHHDFEFDIIDGDKSGMDLLLENLDPSAVDLCVDVAWVQKGNKNPAAFLAQNQSKISYVHLKDFNDQGWIELGRGRVDLASVMGVLRQMPQLRSIVAEQEETLLDPRESVAISRSYLRNSYGY